MKFLDLKHHLLLGTAPGGAKESLRGVFGILALASAIDRDCAARLGRHGISEGRFVVLLLLAGAPEGLAPHEIATRAGVTRATVTGLLDRLERSGQAERRPDPEDRRALRVVLTGQGRRLTDTLLGEHCAWIAGLAQGLDRAEQKLLRRLLLKIWRNTDAGRTAVFEEARQEAG